MHDGRMVKTRVPRRAALAGALGLALALSPVAQDASGATHKHTTPPKKCWKGKGHKRKRIPCPKPKPAPPATSPFVGSAHLTISSSAGSILKGTFTSTVTAFGKTYTGGTVGISVDRSTPQADGSTINDDTVLLSFNDAGAGRLCLSVVEHFNADFSASTGTWNSVGADGGTLAGGSYAATFNNTRQPDGTYVINVNGTATHASAAQPLSAACLALA